MEYRLTEERDLDAVMEIIHDAQRIMGEAGIDQWQDGYPTREQIQKDMEKGESRVWEEDGEVVGTAMITFAGEESYRVIRNGEWMTKEEHYGTIHRIAVKPSCRRRGIAGTLLLAIEKECRDQGIRSLRIDTHKDNKSMRSWLAKNHFHFCGDITLKSSGAPRVAYEKELTPKGEPKKPSEIQIRIASPEDAKELLAIYTPYVEGTVITFEYAVPTLEEFRGRIERILEKYPYLVAECQGEVVGYAYAGVFKNRAAYDWAVENSIYVKADKKRMGIGVRLYEELEKALELQNILNLNACIAYAEKEDEYLTNDSVRFHERMGYRMVGRFRQCGYKYGRWYDMVWMEKHIGTHLSVQPPVKPFPEIRGKWENLRDD